MIMKILIPILLMSSCSLIKKTRESLLGPPKAKPQAAKENKSPYVSRAEYEKLKNDYEALKKNPEMAQDDPYKDRELEVHEMIDDINGVKSDKGFETVDIDPSEGKSSPPKSPAIIVGESVNSSDVAGQTLQTQNAIALFDANNLDGSKNEFAKLVGSPIEQIRARAIYYLGLIHFKEEKHSAALPFFEKMIHEYGFSVLAVNSLRLASISATKLGDQEKAAEYKKVGEAFEGLSTSMFN